MFVSFLLPMQFQRRVDHGTDEGATLPDSARTASSQRDAHAQHHPPEPEGRGDAIDCGPLPHDAPDVGSSRAVLDRSARLRDEPGGVSSQQARMADADSGASPRHLMQTRQKTCLTQRNGGSGGTQMCDEFLRYLRSLCVRSLSFCFYWNGLLSQEPYMGLGRRIQLRPNSAGAGWVRTACERPGKSWMLSPTHISTFIAGIPVPVPDCTWAKRGFLSLWPGMRQST